MFFFLTVFHIAFLVNFRYVRALGAAYMRLTGTSLDCYKYLEPLYYDYRKLKRQKRDGSKFSNN